MLLWQNAQNILSPLTAYKTIDCICTERKPWREHIADRYFNVHRICHGVRCRVNNGSCCSSVNGQCQWNILLITQQRQLSYRTHCAWVTIFSFSRTYSTLIPAVQRIGLVCQSNCCSTKLSISFILSYGSQQPISPESKPIDCMTYDGVILQRVTNEWTID